MVVIVVIVVILDEGGGGRAIVGAQTDGTFRSASQCLEAVYPTVSRIIRDGRHIRTRVPGVDMEIESRTRRKDSEQAHQSTAIKVQGAEPEGEK